MGREENPWWAKSFEGPDADQQEQERINMVRKVGIDFDVFGRFLRGLARRVGVLPESPPPMKRPFHVAEDNPFTNPLSVTDPVEIQEPRVEIVQPPPTEVLPPQPQVQVSKMRLISTPTAKKPAQKRSSVKKTAKKLEPAKKPKRATSKPASRPDLLTAIVTVLGYSTLSITQITDRLRKKRWLPKTDRLPGRIGTVLGNKKFFRRVSRGVYQLTLEGHSRRLGDPEDDEVKGPLLSEHPLPN